MMSWFCKDNEIVKEIEELREEIKKLRKELDIIRYATTVDSIANKLEKKIETMATYIINELKER